jgi:hypothetical protein
MSETEALFTVLRQSSDPDCAAAIEGSVREASDRELCRVNVLAFAAKHGLDEERTIAAYLHASRLGLFELSWNVLCPGCGGVLDAGATLKNVNRDEYDCALCASGYKATLDEMVEVTFTVSPRVRRITAHNPDDLSEVEYYRQMFWSSGVALPETLGESLAEFTVDSIELPPGEKAVLSVQLPAEFVIVFDPVTHGTQFIDVKGEPTRERQTLTMVFNNVKAPVGTIEMRPGPLRLSPRAAGALDRRRSAAPSARQSPAVPDCQAPPDQSDFSRHLSHRHARRRSAAQDHEPDFSVHRSQGLDRAV